MNGITKEFKFSAAHRLEGHPKCSRLHGHNYRFKVHVEFGKQQLVSGMVVDFSLLSELVKLHVVDTLDHRYIVSIDNYSNNDPYVQAASARDDATPMSVDILYSTAECLSEWIGKRIQQAVAHLDLVVVGVTLWETDSSSASWRPDTTA